MGKHFVPSEAHTSASGVRKLLDEAEKLVANLRGTGRGALALLHMIDRIGEGLEELGEGGLDVRPESVRFETVQRQLVRRKKRILAEAGAAFQEERSVVQPDRARWWWFLDEELAQERRQRLRRVLIIAGVVVVLLVVAAIILAPSPDAVHSSRGEALAREGAFEAALAEFEAAAALAPDDPGYWLWQGVVYVELEKPDEAEAAFETARSLSKSDYDFLLQRAQMYLQVENVDAASADVEQAILEKPDAGAGYYVRHGVALARGDYYAALDDLEKTAELARASGDVWLEGTARVQIAFLMQRGPTSPISPQPTPTPQ